MSLLAGLSQQASALTAHNDDAAAHGAGVSNADNTSIACWGDSLTAGWGYTPYPLQLSAASGFRTYNGGVGGDTSTQIAARMVADTGKHSWNTIIWAGRNNYSDAATVLVDVAAMVAALGHDRYHVLAVTNSSGGVSGSAEHIAIVALNQSLSAVYGARFIDVRSALISDGLELAGIAATAQDLTDIANDVIPTSLRADGVHLNTSGYFALAAIVNQVAPPSYVVANGLLGASVQDVLRLLQNPPQIGSGTPWDAYFKSIIATSLGFGGASYITKSGDGTKIQTHGGVIPDGDAAYNLGLSTTAYRWANLYLSASLYLRTTSISRGTGSPEGVVTAGTGSLYLREDGGAGTTLYVKESGTGNTGWSAK